MRCTTGNCEVVKWGQVFRCYIGCMKKYKAILFDLGWTLVDLPSAGQVNLRIEEAVGSDVFPDVQKLFHDWHTANWSVDEFIARVKKLVPMTDTLRVLLTAWGTNAELVPYAETIDTLKALKARGFIVGVISNTPPLNPDTIAGFGFSQYVDAWVFSHELGVSKPDARIFELALTKLSVSADEALMIGDSFDKDILGARAAGIDAVLIARDGIVASEPTVIRSLTELLDRT